MASRTDVSADFLDNPVAFFRQHYFAPTGSITTPPGDGIFDITKMDDPPTFVVQKGAKVKGYLARADANKLNIHKLPKDKPDPYFMFTDSMTGCQFIAYGSSRFDITVEHNNYLALSLQKPDGEQKSRDAYAKRLSDVMKLGNPFFMNLSPGDEIDVCNRQTYKADPGASILGVFKPTVGWQFWIKASILVSSQLIGPF